MKVRVKNLGESKKYKFMDGTVLIRQFPASLSMVEGNIDGFVRISGKQQLEAFVHCLTGWENFEDESGDPVALTDEVKQGLFDYPDPELSEGGEQLVQFVLKRGKVIAAQEEDELGN